MLTVSKLNASYGTSHILFDVDLAVEAGTVVALIGRNGAGKSTTLKSIMGVLPTRKGRITFKGADISAWASDAVCRLGIGYVPEDCRVFRGLTVAENLEAGRRPPQGGRPAWDTERVFALFPDLKRLLQHRAHLLSGGQQRMLAIARTLMGNPKMILLDEPSEGLAPQVVKQMLAQLTTLKQSGVTMLLCEQNLNFSLKLADSAYIIEKGSIQYHGSAAALAADAATRAKYLMV